MERASARVVAERRNKSMPSYAATRPRRAASKAPISLVLAGMVVTSTKDAPGDSSASPSRCAPRRSAHRLRCSGAARRSHRSSARPSLCRRATPCQRADRKRRTGPFGDAPRAPRGADAGAPREGGACTASRGAWCPRRAGGCRAGDERQVSAPPSSVRRRRDSSRPKRVPRPRYAATSRAATAAHAGRAGPGLRRAVPQRAFSSAFPERADYSCLFCQLTLSSVAARRRPRQSTSRRLVLLFVLAAREQIKLASAVQGEIRPTPNRKARRRTALARWVSL